MTKAKDKELDNFKNLCSRLTEAELKNFLSEIKQELEEDRLERQKWQREIDAQIKEINEEQAKYQPGSDEWSKCNEKWHKAIDKLEKNERKTADKTLEITSRKAIVEKELEKFTKAKQARKKELATRTKPLWVILAIVTIITAIAVVIHNNVEQEKERKQAEDPLNLKGYTLGYACDKLDKSDFIVQAKTYSDAISGVGDSEIDGVRVTDYPINCEDYLWGDRSNIWNYYVMSYKSSGSSKTVYWSIIVGTKSEAESEGITIKKDH